MGLLLSHFFMKKHTEEKLNTKLNMPKAVMYDDVSFKEIQQVYSSNMQDCTGY